MDDYNISKIYIKSEENLDYNPLSTNDFYNESNVNSALKHLNYELNNIGISSITLPAEDKQTQSIITAFFSLLDKAQKNSRFNQDFQIRYRNIESDYDSAVAYSERLKAKIESKDREIHDLTVEKSSMTKEVKQKQIKHKQITEEIRQLKVNHLHALNQFAHDLRKKEVDTTRLKEKVQKIINDKYKVNKVDLSIMNPGLLSNITHPSSEEEDYYTELVKNYSIREETLVNENLKLIDIIKEFFNGLKEIIKKQEANNATVYPSLDNYNLGIEGDKTKIENSIKKILDLLSEIWKNLQEKSKPSAKSEMFDMTTQTTESEVKIQGSSKEDLEKIQALTKELRFQAEESTKLKAKITEYRQTISSLQELLDKTIFDNQLRQIELSTPDITAPEIEEAQKKIDDQRQELEQNRKKLTEAAVALGYDRSQFLKEKQQFEEEKKQFDIEKAINSIPEAPQWIKDLDIAKVQSDSGVDLNELNYSDLLKAGSEITSPKSETSVTSAASAPGPSSRPLRGHLKSASINLKSKGLEKGVSEPKPKRTPSQSVDLTKPISTRPRPSGMASLMRPTASQILKAQAAQAKQDELLIKSGNKIPIREHVRRHAMSPTPCTKPNCLVHKKIKEQQEERERKLKTRANGSQNGNQ
ncbi:hypothetical protein K502DRAFT_333735 [Neoconidiobolus thromboides FSU 785]|nr:hypothetical protein K502DRAFT_333735 [Neoconidiobolus thromboides FSU 785]